MSMIEALERRQLWAVGGITLAAGYTASEYAGGLGEVTSAAFLPDGRLLVAGKSGTLSVVKGAGGTGGAGAAPVTALTLGVNASGERGLGGVVVDPGFAGNGFVYLYYTAAGKSPHNRVSRFTLAGDGVVPGSERVLLNLPTLKAAIHNGGGMLFGADGKLYVGVGDNNQRTLVQNVASPFGKVLRLNSDGTPPGDNPFATGRGTGWAEYVWARGLRNPFTAAVQPGSGLMYFNDVGQAAFEEIDAGVRGANYGWPQSEGPAVGAGETAPFYSYAHVVPPGGTTETGAVAGGAFAPDGLYYFGDVTLGNLRTLDPATGAVAEVATGLPAPLDVDIGPDGAVYVTNLVGRVIRLEKSGVGTSVPGPSITGQPRSTTGAVGTPVTFTVEAASSTNSGEVRYQWQRNGADVAGATGPELVVTPARADDGARYRVVVSNDEGAVVSSTALLTVDTNRPPVPVIVTPAAGAVYSAGKKLTLKFAATDPDQKSVDVRRFEYRVVFHHGEHTHPFVEPVTGKKSASVTPPADNEVATNVFYRVHFKVTDDKGLSTEVTRDVLPRVVTLGVTTNVTGLAVAVDSVPTQLSAGVPLSFDSVAGVKRTLSFPKVFEQDGVTWQLQKGPRGKLTAGVFVATLSAPEKATSYALVYKQVKAK